MNSRKKGKRGERDFRDFLRDMGFTARRGQQFAGGADSPDVIVEELPFVHFEVKFGAKFAIGTSELDKAWSQAVRDAGGKKTPVVAFRRNREFWKLMHMDEDGSHVLLWRQSDIKYRLQAMNRTWKKEVGPKE